MAADSKLPGEDRRKGPKTGPRGQQPFVPSDEQRRIVLAAKSVGIENAAIAKALRIDRDTLAKHFADELSDGREQLHAVVAGKLVQIALDDKHKDQQRAGQFLLQSQFGWQTQQQLNFGMRGAPADADAAPSEDQVLPARITVEFVNTRPLGLPGAAAPADKPAE